jgi:hypothetical protein
MTPLRTANIINEGAEFLAQGNENFIFVFDRL